MHYLYFNCFTHPFPGDNTLCPRERCNLKFRKPCLKVHVILFAGILFKCAFTRNSLYYVVTVLTVITYKCSYGLRMYAWLHVVVVSFST